MRKLKGSVLFCSEWSVLFCSFWDTARTPRDSDELLLVLVARSTRTGIMLRCQDRCVALLALMTTVAIVCGAPVTVTPVGPGDCANQLSVPKCDRFFCRRGAAKQFVVNRITHKTRGTPVDAMSLLLVCMRSLTSHLFTKVKGQTCKKFVNLVLFCAVHDGKTSM